MSKLFLFALHGICGSFHIKATIHVSALHCVLSYMTERRQVWHAFNLIQKWLLSSHPWPNMNDNVPYERRRKSHHPLIRILWFFFSILRDLGLNLGFDTLYCLQYHDYKWYLYTQFSCDIMRKNVLYVTSEFIYSTIAMITFAMVDYYI